MFLKDYISEINKKYSKVFFSGISFDSNKVKKNHIFFAIKGNKFDGNNYIDIAIKKGATIIISERNVVLFKPSKELKKKINVKNEGKT